MANLSIKQLALGLSLSAASFQLLAVPTTYDGITFPDGDVSFADAVISYDNAYGGGTVPTDLNFLDPDAAIGPPDYPDASAPGTGSVSLGSGGLIQLLFSNNSLTNSGDADNDLHIFEIGPDVEDTFVAIRPTADTLSLLGAFSGREINDGFFSIGKVFGATSSLDIDSVFGGLGAGQLRFDAVQLIDDIAEGASSGSTVGADIDAVGAIFSAPPVPREVPEPGSLALLAGGLLLSSVFRLARGRSQDR